MKTKIILIFGLLSVCFSYVENKQSEKKSKHSLIDSIHVFSSPALYNLTCIWTREYHVLHPEVNLDVVQISGNIKNNLENGTGLGFVNDESYTALYDNQLWNLEVGHDVIVPIMNSANPLKAEIFKKGLTTEEFARILQNPESQDWGKFLNSSKNYPLHFYLENESSVFAGVSNYTKTYQSINKHIRIVDRNELISAIQKDPAAMGFCKLIHSTDQTNQKLIEGIELVPIDKNGNGKIDYIENIYDNLQAFNRAVWIGKFPKSLSGTIYSVSTGKPDKMSEITFLKWILTDGQKYLSLNGYYDLVYNERQTQLERLDEYTSSPQSEIFPYFKTIILTLMILLLVGFGVDLIFRYIHSKKRILPEVKNTRILIFDEDSLVLPKGLYFDKTHTWAFMKKEGLVKIGIDDFLQHITGTITRIEMKNEGEKIKKGEKLFTIIRKGKQLSIYSPISGTIKMQNAALIANASLINSGPYSNGWVYLIEPSNWFREIQYLNMADKYKAWLKEELLKIKDLFSASFKNSDFAYTTLQDGGALKDHLLADLGPEFWEEFQTKFLDSSR